jgi:hypothetical protein
VRICGSSDANGFVQEHHLGFDRERSGQGDALPLAARELMGVAARQIRQPHELEQVAHPPPAGRAGEREADVRRDREMGKEAALLCPGV